MGLRKSQRYRSDLNYTMQTPKDELCRQKEPCIQQEHAGCVCNLKVGQCQKGRVTEKAVTGRQSLPMKHLMDHSKDSGFR